MTLLSQTFPFLSSGPALRVLGALVILAFGHLLVRIVKSGLRKYRRRESEIPIDIREENVNLVTSFLNIGVILLALAYLNVGLGSQVQQALIQQAPKLFSVVLIGILGIIFINIAERALSDFFKTLGLKNYLKDAGMSSASFGIFSAGVKVFLYLVLAQVMLYQLKLNITLINQLLNAFSWAFAFLVAGVVFYSVKDLFQNLGAGVYLQNSRELRSGEEVRIGEDAGEIKDISLFGTKLETRDGYTLLKPNSTVINSDLRFKRAKSDLEVLEKINSYFQTTGSGSGEVASVRMASEFFDLEITEDEVREAFSDEDMNGAAEKLSDSGMKAAWIESGKISSLEDEYKSWFNDGALIVTRFDKEQLFTDSDSGKFALSAGVESGDILNIDPVKATSGGVYYVESERMRELMGSEDGYLVLAPEGTTAYWRIKKDLVYSDENLYDELSKTLENKLRKIMRQGRMLDDVSPEVVRQYVKKWGREDTNTKLWTPSGREENGTSGNN